MRDTSLNAYYNYAKPTLGNRQKVVFEKLMERNNWTNSELAKSLGFGINQITPRVGELRKMELVEEAGKRICGVTGLRVHSWRVKTKITPIFKNPETTLPVYSEVKQLQMI